MTDFPYFPDTTNVAFLGPINVPPGLQVIFPSFESGPSTNIPYTFPRLSVNSHSLSPMTTPVMLSSLLVKVAPELQHLRS